VRCNVCDSPLGTPLYEAPSGGSLTSLCERREGQVRVWRCAHCGHLRGEPLQDERRYYQDDYRILLDHDDEDQIYEVRDGHITYRTDHQVRTLLDRLSLPPGARLLDYGCAKGSMPARLLALRPDLQVHLFDVSSMYREHWRRLVPDDRQAVDETPGAWRERFDVVTSFFALEHITQPVETVRKVAALLSDHGTFYGIVPDTFGNMADLVVIDHVNHFTPPSLHRLLHDAGFRHVVIEDQAHRGALVFRASRAGAPTPVPAADTSAAQAERVASHWRGMNERIHRAEDTLQGRPVAVYGSGFYGAYILTAMRDTSHVRCVLDASPFRQGRRLFDLPILAPEAMPEEVHDMLVGLNPIIARRSVSEMSWLRGRTVRPLFLDGEAS
jgi:ubiquinone/menaquinone biosynthesis C-methylase UbiE